MTYRKVVLLDVIEPGVEPEYCTHGRCPCVGNCGEWLWLGHETVRAVQSGEMLPVCRPCLEQASRVSEIKIVDQITDHRRADGPHE